MYHVLKQSENTLYQATSSLFAGKPIPLKTSSMLKIYGFGNIICAYVCVHVLYFSIDKYDDISGAIIASCLISLFTFLFIGAMKQIAVGFRFFRVCDIENGALSLLSLMSLIIRFIFVLPIWVCFLSDCPLGSLPSTIPLIAKFYIIGKIAGLWILCSDISNSCKSFFATVLLKMPGTCKCQNCKRETESAKITQCGHVLCMDCIERGRKVSAACVICNSSFPRKWTMPFRYGTLPDLALFCIL